MSKSQNGYEVIPNAVTDGPLPRLRKWIIPGSNRHFFMRDGSVGFILAHFILWFHESIEPIDRNEWDDWGWAYRPIRGKSSGFSNHASGTAVDINATEHPMGVNKARTFTWGEIWSIRARLVWMRRAIAWGGEWDRPDGMHFEIRVPLRVCEKHARRLSRSARGKRILDANPGARKVIFS